MNIQRVEFQINWKCNMNCVFCFQNGSRSSEELPFQTAVDVMDQLKDSLKIVWITGGEPLLSLPLLFRVAQEAKKRGLYVGISSNGLILGDVIDDLKDLGVDEIRVSLDSTDPGIFERIRGVPGGLGKVMSNLSAAAVKGIRVSVRCTVTRLNAATVPKVIEAAKEMGACRVELKSVLPIGRGDRETMLDARELARLFSEAYRLKTPATDVMVMCNHLPQCQGFDVENNVACQCAREYIYIYCDGSIAPCSYFPMDPMLNLKTLSIREAWNSPLFRSVRNSNPEECDRCDTLAACRNGCPAVLYQYGRFGDYCFDLICELTH